MCPAVIHVCANCSTVTVIADLLLYFNSEIGNVYIIMYINMWEPTCTINFNALSLARLLPCPSLQSNGNLVIGAPGTYLWRGANFVYNGSGIIPSTKDTLSNFGYSGMSVRQARVSSPSKLGQ